MHVEKNKENMIKCICMMCPSYEKTCKIGNGNQDIIPQELSQMIHCEKMFCAFEKSDCIKQDRGCLCQRCEVFKKYDLKHREYCLKTGGI